MSSIQIKKELATYLPLLSERQQEIVLDMVKNFLQIDKKEKRTSIEKYNTEIEEALKEVREGKTLTHQEMKNRTEKWLKHLNLNDVLN